MGTFRKLHFITSSKGLGVVSGVDLQCIRFFWWNFMPNADFVNRFFQIYIFDNNEQ